MIPKEEARKYLQKKLGYDINNRSPMMKAVDIAIKGTKKENDLKWVKALDHREEYKKVLDKQARKD